MAGACWPPPPLLLWAGSPPQLVPSPAQAQTSPYCYYPYYNAYYCQYYSYNYSYSPYESYAWGYDPYAYVTGITDIHMASASA